MVDNNKLKSEVLFLCGFGFPIGYSGANRVMSLSKGLVEKGNNVKVYVLFPTEKKNNLVNDFNGVYNGVQYQYPFKRVYKLENLFLRKLDIFYAILITLFKLFWNKNPRIIINTSDEAWIVLLVGFIRFFSKSTKLIYYVDEYPPAIRLKNLKRISLISSLFYKLGIPNYHGFISMTDALISYYRNYLSEQSIIKLPITVESGRFDLNPTHQNGGTKYIGYIGNFDNSKDGIDFLLKAFSLINSEYPEYELHLAGEGKNHDMIFLKSLINSLGINEKVKLLGKVHRENVPIFLQYASVLCMARPYSLRNEGGFPTKLGEYLLSGVPVVVTDVGEIHDFLEDGKSIFLANPGDVDSFVEKLTFVIENYEIAQRIAIEGKRIALKEFDYLVQANRLHSFLYEIENSNI